MGGGTGQFSLLSGLRELNGIEITAVVSMADSGGSTGRLRDELGILPPGDVLKCILALSPHREVARNILLKRFMGDQRLKGHNAGNLLLTMLSRYTGSFPAGVQALAEILDVRGTILPVSLDKATLVAELTDGKRIYGQAAIAIPQTSQRDRIRNVFLVPHHTDSISVFPPVVDVLKNADYIIIAPGDLYSSIMPNLVVPGVKEALQKSRAMLLYVINIMTKCGETDTFTGYDFVQRIEECIGREMDGILYNQTSPGEEILQRYRAEKAEIVEINEEDSCWGRRRIFSADLVDTAGAIVRHDPHKLSRLIKEIIS